VWFTVWLRPKYDKCNGRCVCVCVCVLSPLYYYFLLLSRDCCLSSLHCVIGFTTFVVFFFFFFFFFFLFCPSCTIHFLTLCLPASASALSVPVSRVSLPNYSSIIPHSLSHTYILHIHTPNLVVSTQYGRTSTEILGRFCHKR
jgi:hypothetical protein